MRIVIVEDEKKTLHGIVSLCRQMGEEYEVAGWVRNGEEGCRLVHEMSPDVVLTDVRMPLKSGLEMIQQLVGEGCKSKFIILSGFAEFEFAQEAMKLGSVDYLLKPITRDALRKSLEHVREMLKEDTSRNNLTRLTEEELLTRLMNTEDAFGEEFLRELQQRKGKASCLVAVLRSDTRIRSSDLEEVRQLISGDREEKDFSFGFSETRREICILLWGRGKEVLFRLAMLMEEIRKRTRTRFVCACSSMEELERLPEAIRRTSELCNWNLSLECPDIVQESTVKALSCEKLIYPTYIERRLAEKIYSGKTEDISTEIQEFTRYLREKTYDYRDIREAILCLMVSVLYAIRQANYGVYDEINHLNVLDWIKDKVFLSSITQMLLNMVGELERYQKNLQQGSHPLVKKALKLIENDYKRDITVDEVAGMLKITPEYLSTLFTKELGVKFTVYCTQKRVNYAKELFHTRQNIKAYEVAKECGYADVKYFCKVFKKYTGKSPSEYQHSFHV